MKKLFRTLSMILLFAFLAAGWVPVRAVNVNWLQFNFDPQHSGANPSESIINKTNLSHVTFYFQATLPDIADGAPVYLGGVATATGTRDLLFMTTHAGHILALDAHTGASVWAKQFGSATCKINGGSNPCYTTSSPAIDPNLAYVYSYGLDGKIHKLQVGDGAEVTSGGWPETATLKGLDEKGSPALNIASSGGTNYLYMASGGYPGDGGDYQGHITVVNLSTGAQKVFNAVCSNQTVHFLHSPASPDCAEVQTAIWSRSSVVYDPSLDRIFMSTGNGTFDPANHHWGDTLFKLNPDGSGASGNPLDTYTPTNYQNLQNADADLGSTNVAILPVPASSTVQHLGVQSGKDGKLRLVNLQNLSGQSGIGHTGGEVGPIINVPQGGAVLTAPAVWVNPATNDTWVFVADDSGISGLRLVVSAGVPHLSPVWQKTPGGTSPVTANGVLYYASSGAVRALDPLTGLPLWSKTIGSLHWESPIVVNGVVYISDESKHLTAFHYFVDVSTLTKKNYLPAVER